MCFTKRILVQYFSKRLLSILNLFTLLPVLPQAQGQSKFWEFLVWMANGESGQDRFIRCNIKNSAIMMGNKTPLLLCFNYVVSKAFSSSNSSYIFFSLNGSIGFLRLYSLYCKIKKSLRMDWEEREREREVWLVSPLYLSELCSVWERETGFAHFTACSNSSLRTEIQGGAWARAWKVIGIDFSGPKIWRLCRKGRFAWDPRGFTIVFGPVCSRFNGQRLWFVSLMPWRFS